ncbi:MAG TPA: hypothetical protein VJ899_09260 [Salegentibacter sp.]|nr:hypothetical protein [Salegentibacter sp.]
MNRSRRKYRLFYSIEEHLEVPMFILAILWLSLFIVELLRGISSTEEIIIYCIWAVFILEFLLKFFLAPRKKDFLKNNVITLVALIIPAFRVLRIFYAFRVLSSVRIITSTNIIRALTSGKRFFTSLKEAQGPQPTPEMNVGFLIATGKDSNADQIEKLAKQIANLSKEKLVTATSIPWYFDMADKVKLDNDNPRSASDFLDRASLKMAEGPYDMVCVITDVPLMSSRNTIQEGLSSEVTRVMVISTKEFINTKRRKNSRKLDSLEVQMNIAKLFLHLTGHILGLKHRTAGNSKIMRVFSYVENTGEIPSFTAAEKEYLKKYSGKMPDRELKNGNFVETFIFHILMTFRHPGKFFKPLLRNWAVLLPLSLPNLATAAVAPALILIFTAEIWDVGLGMANGTAAFFAIISIMFASFYLVRVQNLFLPMKEKRILTEHLAVANSVIYVSVFLACIGLFVMVGGLMMIIAIYVFPADLITTWPTLNKPEVTLADKIRLAVFISTVGVTTGALAGGLENKTLIQELTLFKNKT